MKNLELSHLEIISGGVDWYMVGKYILGTIIIVELFYLQYKVTYDFDECVYMKLGHYNSLKYFIKRCHRSLEKNIN